MAVKFQDYYQTLGVTRTATPEEIQRAYRKLARQFHPDVNKAKDAEAKFKQINEAHEVLKDPDKRRRYDELGENWKAGQDFAPPGYEAATGFRPGSGFHYRSSGDASDFSDFFETFFGRGAGRGAFEEMFRQAPGNAGRGPGRRGSRGGPGMGGGGFGGPDGGGSGGAVESELTITLEDAYFGGTRRITLQSSDGQGFPPRTFDVKIPKGITDGATIRLKAPAPGSGGAPGTADPGVGGDLLLHIKIAPHPRFGLDGRNLTMTLPISAWEAALGAKVPVSTLDGQVTLTVPPGSQSGRKLRLRGKGMPARGDHEAGDLIVQLQVYVPPTLTDEERKLFEQLKDVSKFDPRS